MKNFKTFLLLVAIISATITINAKEKPKVKEVTYECSIDCHSCKAKIMKNIPYEKGIKKVEVDIEKKLVKIAFREDKNNVDNIEKALEKLGYEAELVKTPKKKE